MDGELAGAALSANRRRDHGHPQESRDPNVPRLRAHLNRSLPSRVSAFCAIVACAVQVRATPDNT
jgi:hypothetical protein